MRTTRFVLALGLPLALACSSSSAPPSAAASGGAAGGGGSAPSERGPDAPILGLSAADRALFDEGDGLFDLPLREPDGLGPLYIRDHCGSCHHGATRGPGSVQKMSVVDADGVTPALDQSKLLYGNTVRPSLAAGAKTPVAPPTDASVRVSTRVGAPLMGRSYIEAIDDAEIVRVAAEQAKRPDAIHGRVSYVTYASEANPDTTYHQHQKGDMVIGRFGLKARNATLDDFTADAFQRDLGITSPLRPTELPNPDGLLDDAKPGVDVSADLVNSLANYLRRLALPARTPDAHGLELFVGLGCGVCHQPTLHTRKDYPIALLADIDAPIYSDLLLHDMGDALADGVGDGGTSDGRAWRTAPLIGLRYDKTYLHDGRVTTVRDAILALDSPGSEASGPVQAFKALSPSEQDALVAFVSSLLISSPPTRGLMSRALRLHSIPFFALALASIGGAPACSSSSAAPVTAPNPMPDAGAAKTDAEYRVEVTAAVKLSLTNEIATVLQACQELQAVAPTPAGRGWDAKLDAAAIADMKTAWRKARTAYEHIEGAIAPIFPDLDNSLDARYDDFLTQLNGMGDPDPFDDAGVIGLHAAERVIWSDAVPPFVASFEGNLQGYAPAAFPATEADALRFKQKLLGQIIKDAQTLAKEWAAANPDLDAAFSGLVSLMKEQREKVNKASTGEEESRYSQVTLTDLRNNREGTRAIYSIFRPWILSKQNPADPSLDGPTHDAIIGSQFDALEKAYDAIGGEAIPQPPPGWSALAPTPSDLMSPFGQLYATVKTAIDPTKDGSMVKEMSLVAGILGFASVKPGM